jgi:HEAT repeat protein/thioredoxin-related protein
MGCARNRGPVAFPKWKAKLAIASFDPFNSLLAFLLLALSAYAESPASKPVFHTSLKAASEAAAGDQSLVLLIFGAEWCGPCKALEKTTLKSGDFLEGGGPLRVAHVDIDADPKTARAFAINAVPTLVLLTADSKIVLRRTGYVEPGELLAWLEEGRNRVKRGQWEGTAPGSLLDPFLKKVAGPGLDASDLTQLATMLGDADPAERNAVAKLLLAQREQAVPALIEAVSDSYLGVRIAASDLLQRLAPQTVSIDPWQSPDALQETIALLKEWWAKSGKLPPPSATRTLDPSESGSIQAALEALRGQDPLERTEAMSTLVGHGAAALPSVREAIKRAERAGELRAVALLEDVRWSILVSDATERRAGGVRTVLARGKSLERQDAATRLGRAGRAAVEPLSELVNDTDPLVVENAVRALSSIGGQDAVPAMAGLLQAADSNLRLTAAQALGRARSPQAVPHLLTVLADPNEVVACAALAALEEVHAKAAYSSVKEPLSAEVIAGLRKCLADSRWRVRATAAEVIGKMRVAELAPDLQKLLDDADGFVVKNALVALTTMSAAPEVSRLAALAQRLPSLRGDAVQMLVQSGSDEGVEIVQAMYDQGGLEEKLAILGALAPRADRQDLFFQAPGFNASRPDRAEDVWKPLLTQAGKEPDARLRRTAAQALSRRSLKLAAELVGPLLTDEDAATRVAAAEVVLGILAAESRGASRVMASGEFAPDEIELPRGSGASASKTNQPVATAQQRAAWHTAISTRAGTEPPASVAAALFATGDGKADLPTLAAALSRLDSKGAKEFAATPAIPVIVRQLTWPEGQAVLEQFSRLSWLFIVAVGESERAAPDVKAYLLEPSRFRAAVEPLNREDLGRAMQRMLMSGGSGEGRRWSLLSSSDQVRAVATALLDSTNAAWRAAALYVLGRRETASHLAAFEKALAETNAWVRATAAQGLAHGLKDRSALEARLGPLLADPGPHVAEVAALGLLEAEVRQAAGLQWTFDHFQYQSLHAGASEGYALNEDRPLTTLESKPAFLEDVRRRLTSTNVQETVIFALLLAQHGEFDGVDQLVARKKELIEERDVVSADAVLTGIALSREAKYVPFLSALAEPMKNDWELRKILRAAKGMSGPEARQLRLDINKRMRTQTSRIMVE